MRYTYANRAEINERYIHDSSFTGYRYDYEKQQMVVSCIDGYEKLGSKFQLVFHNVIYFEMQSCKLWAVGIDRIYDIWVEEDSELMKRILDMIRSEKEWDLPQKDQYIEIKIQILSGDTISIICESMDWIYME